MLPPLEIVNLDEARFECTFGRGCDGLCCREGRPPVYPEDLAAIEQALPRAIPLLRPRARAAVRRRGFLSPRRRRLGQPILRVADGWCVFFNSGCVLHRLGAEEGDAARYKPSLCALFPIQQDREDRWYVRQKGYRGESWDLFCLDADRTVVPARESLAAEIALARRFDEEQKREAEGLIATPGPPRDEPIRSSS